MAEEKSKIVKAKRFFKNVKGWKRFVLFSGIYLIIFLVLLAGAAEYTSRPSFCPTCHYMETFYHSWKISAHSKVDCVECHFEPGISGTVRGKLNGLVQIVNYVSLSYKKRKPWAEIPDNTCARSGCHDKQRLNDSTYNFRGITFSHKNHLTGLKNGKTLKCISCHSQIVQGTHMEVTVATCYTCHFKKSSDLEYIKNTSETERKVDKLSDCNTCHDFQNKTKEQLAGLRYNHTSVVDKKIACESCHTNTTDGKGEVGKERCFQCHFETEKLEKITDTELIHNTHIEKHSMSCINCHNVIEHKIQKLKPDASPDCNSCHTNAHSSQVSLFSGENGFDVEKSPSTMFLNGINCKGCHVFHEKDKNDISTSKAKGSSCEKCHGPGYERLVNDWEITSIKRLGVIRAIYNAADRQVKNSKNANVPVAEKYMEEADHNMRLVEVGKSVHNVQFSDKLLVASYDLIKKSLSAIGSNTNLPEFKSSADIVPNECNSCHSGIQEISVKKFGMNFSHNVHIVKNKVACDRCHSNENKHGELTMSKESCNSCHHVQGKNNDACASCHSFQEQVYSGKYMNSNQPDFMQVGGSGCIDCHISSDKVIKPDNKVCLKCHDAGYDAMMDEWKGDINKLTNEVSDMLKNINTSSLNDVQADVVKDARKLVSDINSHPSIYIHNYDMFNTLLTEKKQKLKKMLN